MLIAQEALRSSLLNKKQDQISDQELIKMYRNSHDNKYVGELYLRYLPLVIGLCMKYFKNYHQAEDCSTEIFEKVMVELRRHQVEHFKSWLYILSKNHCLMLLRKKRKDEVPLSQMNGFLLDFMEIGPEVNLYDEEQSEKLRRKLIRAINSLKDKQKECIELFYFENLSYQEISERSEMSLKEVKSHLQNGKRNLKIKLEES